MTPTREQVYDAMCMALPGVTSQDVKAATDVVWGFLTEVVQPEIDRLTAVANAAGQGWRVAADEAEEVHKEFAARGRTIDKLNQQLRDGDVQREHQRRDLAQANDRIRELEAQRTRALRANQEGEL